jgi:hypothetical protein
MAQFESEKYEGGTMEMTQYERFQSHTPGKDGSKMIQA